MKCRSCQKYGNEVGAADELPFRSLSYSQESKVYDNYIYI